MIKLIVGLANLEFKYLNTRHNVGAWYINKLIEYYSQTTLKKDKKFCGYTGELILSGSLVRLLIPTTYMNLSGISVVLISKFYQLFSDQILIAHDELDLNPGDIRLKFSGSDNGHNGVKDVIRRLGNKNFYRLRIGIGRPKQKKQISEFVLNEPFFEEKKKLV